MMTRSSWMLIGAMTALGMMGASALRMAAPEPVPAPEAQELKVIVRNEGGDPLPAGVPVSVSLRINGVETPLTLLRTPGPLAPGATSPPMGIGLTRDQIRGDLVVRTRDDGAGALRKDSDVWVIPAP